MTRKRVGAFSGGMKQRLGIAQALLNHPALLIVDEPTAGLDPVERVHFRTLLAELSTHSTILLSTHIVADVASACTDLAVLQRGRVVYRGTPVALAGQAAGRVWRAIVAPEQLPLIERACTVAGATADARGSGGAPRGCPTRQSGRHAAGRHPGGRLSGPGRAGRTPR